MKEVGIKVDYVLEFDVLDDLIVECIVGCWVYVVLGWVYYIKFNLLKVEDKDDVIGEDLIICKDDQEVIVCKCLVEYYQ